MYKSIKRNILKNDEIKKILVSIAPTFILNVRIDTIRKKYENITISEKRILSVDYPPVGYDMYVVSRIFADAWISAGYPADGFYIPENLVFSRDGKTIVGCKELRKVKMEVI
jgi:hypothetical protein